MRSTLLGALLVGGLALGLASPAHAQGYYGQSGGYQYGSTTGYTTQSGGYYARSNGYATRPGYPAINPGYANAYRSGYSYNSGYRGYGPQQPGYGYGGAYSNAYSGYSAGQGAYVNTQRRGFMRFR